MSYGEDILDKYVHLMTGVPFERNYRPAWLLGLELDFYFPSVHAALEFQGDQHYKPVWFPNQVQCSSYCRIKLNDKAKRRICASKGITLLRIDACDLEFSRLQSIFKTVRGLSSKHRFKTNKTALRDLNKEATAYRKLLRNNFDSIAALRRDNPERKSSSVCHL